MPQSAPKTTISPLPSGGRYEAQVDFCQGALLADGGGVRYRTWCAHETVSVLVVDKNQTVLRTVKLDREHGNYFSGVDEGGSAGDLYFYCFAEGKGWPDPASRWQPLGVHGPSMVIDPGSYLWRDSNFNAPDLSELVIYEMHIGTFTREGTFRSAVRRLAHIADLGVNAIEIMPVADFPGQRNWGYDNVSLYAPSRAYGHPDDLRALVDAAHALNLAVILDVVYNHLGPDGNYLGAYHPAYFHPSLKTPWGSGFDFNQEPVRRFFSENSAYWLRDFHIDGLRLDATHAISDDSPTHILAEIAGNVHRSGGFVIAEDERNEPGLLRHAEQGGFGLDAVWADDFHHSLRVMLTEDRQGYLGNYQGSSAELAETISHGWYYRGQASTITGKPRGADPEGLKAHQFVYCISNHDQVGNRAFGERLGTLITPSAYRAASALLCLVPRTPLLFMGQEWNASTPFQFFTDHSTELGKLVTAGRREEFRDFDDFRNAERLHAIPDPQAKATYENSKLKWHERKEPTHEGVLALYREFLRLRRSHSALLTGSGASWKALELGPGVLAILFGSGDQERAYLLLANLTGSEAPTLHDPRIRATAGSKWRLVVSSNERRFGGDHFSELEPETAFFGAI